MADAGALSRTRVTWRPVLLVVGCLACQMGAGFFYASRALAPDVIADLGWTRTMWSSGMAPMLFVSSISQAFVGAACVRFGVRPVVVAGVLCLAMSVAALGTMQSIWQFYVAMMLMALGNAGIGDVAIGGVITRWFARHRSLALGFAMVGTNIGAVFFVHTMAQVSEIHSWRTAALSVGLGGFAVILPFAIFIVRDPKPGEAQEVEAEGAGADLEADERARRALADDRVFSIPEILRHPALWILSYALFCYSFVQLGTVDHLVLYLGDLGYDREEASGALELAVGAGILAKLGAGVIALRLPPKKLFVANTAMLAVSLLLVPFAADGRVLALFGLLFGLSTAARDVLLPLAVAETFGVRSFAQVYGIMMLAFIPGGGLGPIVLARAHDLLGSYRPGFAGSIGLLVVAVLALAIWVRWEDRPGHAGPNGAAPA